ncbi:hypothetical protein CEXT_705451 [Caerostris extrusa]|uniref:Uncharacterized protein n=1 Tax=Caerostris extrusa TaxID=172846 RepID=A0AAV4Q5F7_CAEEX|nr:hypothetical protein CEXT_705451 [Caerostris extrusa]
MRPPSNFPNNSHGQDVLEDRKENTTHNVNFLATTSCSTYTINNLLLDDEHFRGNRSLVLEVFGNRDVRERLALSYRWYISEKFFIKREALNVFTCKPTYMCSLASLLIGNVYYTEGVWTTLSA